MSTPTQRQIDELQALLEARTPGEWSLGGCSGRMIVKRGYGTIADVEEIGSNFKDFDGNPVIADTDVMAHAKLIVALHNTAPALLSAARENLRLRETRDAEKADQAAFYDAVTQEFGWDRDAVNLMNFIGNLHAQAKELVEVKETLWPDQTGMPNQHRNAAISIAAMRNLSERRIAELEAENAKLKEQLEKAEEALRQLSEPSYSEGGGCIMASIATSYFEIKEGK